MALLLLCAAGCTVPALDLSAKKCASAADCSGGQSCGADGACVTPPSVAVGDAGVSTFCQGIPRFTGVQTVDGDASDLSTLPVISYPWTALVPSGGTAIVGDKLDTTAQIGWSDLGVHLYFHVAYETGQVIVPTGDDELWYGDALEIFLKGDGTLTGGYGNGLDPGALQIIVTPDPSAPPRTEMAVDYGMDLGPLTAAQVAVVRDPDATGYSVEYLIPWSRISAPGASATGPGAGQTIGFQFGVDYRNREDGGLQPGYQLTLALSNIAGTSTCTYQPIPSCDDRTWCSPTLLP